MSKKRALVYSEQAIALVKTGEKDDAMLDLIEATDESVRAKKHAASRHFLTAMHEVLTGNRKDTIAAIERGQRALRR